jgi:hypothetical protein
MFAKGMDASGYGDGLREELDLGSFEHSAATVPGTRRGARERLADLLPYPRAVQWRVRVVERVLPPAKASFTLASGKTAPGKPFGAGQPALR